MNFGNGFASELEHDALDKIHLALRRNKRGLLVGQIAEQTGLGRGYVLSILKKSECVIKRRPYHRNLWWADWGDLPENFRPKFKTGRPPAHHNGS
jgi:hypothetical protein